MLKDFWKATQVGGTLFCVWSPYEQAHGDHTQKKDDCLSAIVLPKIFVAERQGFEPWIPEGITVFETAPIDHSGISPNRVARKAYFSFGLQMYE